jgi:hypothetical protein
MDAIVVRDIISIVFERGGINRQQPQAIHPQFLYIIQLFDHAAQIAMTVVVAIVKCAHI